MRKIQKIMYRVARIILQAQYFLNSDVIIDGRKVSTKRLRGSRGAPIMVAVL